MWVELVRAKSLLIAEAWQEFVEESYIPCRLYWPDPRQRGIADAACRVLVPGDRKHVAELAEFEHLF